MTTTQIGRPELWRDELATWSAASRSLPQLWRLLHHIDAVLGPYYLLEHAWMSAFGDSATAMRLPSALAMTATAAVVALTARRLVTAHHAAHADVAALAAGMIFAFIPAVTRYGQEARPYAFAALFSALSTLALLALFDRRTWYRWAGYALALAAAGATSLVTLSVLAGHAVAAAPLRGDRGWRPCRAAPRALAVRFRLVTGFAACAVLAIAVDAPLILTGRQQASSQLDNLPHPGWLALWTLWPQLFSSGPVSVALPALAVAGLIAGPVYRRACGFAVAVALVPVLAVWIVSHGAVSYWTTRYFIFTLPGWAVAAGVGVAAVAARVRAPAARYGVAAVLTALPLAAGVTAQAAVRAPQAHNWWTYPAPSGDIPLGYAQAADIIAAHEEADDGIAFQVSDDNRWQVDKGILYYLGDRHPPRTVFQSLTAQQAGLLAPVECARPADCLDGTRRIWVVYIDHLVRHGRGGTPYQALPPAATATLHAGGYRVLRTYDADGIIVSLLISTKSEG